MAELSPLHRVIDARQWDAERLLGRLILLVHAAFLDAGFVPHAHAVPVNKSDRVPRRVGATASTLSLRYAAPQSHLHLHLQDAPVALRMRAVGMQVVFYVCVSRFAGDAQPVMHRACVDARSVAPLLSGGLDDTASALTDEDGASLSLASLWRELTEELSKRAYDDLCHHNALVSLPSDVVLAILARLPRNDLSRLANTCAELRSLVADHRGEVWGLWHRMLVRLVRLTREIGGGKQPKDMKLIDMIVRYVKKTKRYGGSRTRRTDILTEDEDTIKSKRSDSEAYNVHRVEIPTRLRYQDGTRPYLVKRKKDLTRLHGLHRRGRATFLHRFR